MSLNRKTLLIFTILLGLWGRASPLDADGLETSFVDVMVQRIPLGRVVAVSDEQGRDLVIKNLGNQAVSIRAEVLVPAEKQLLGGAQAIPDPRWITVSPAALQLPALGERKCKVSVRVPPDRVFGGRYYEAMIWTHSVPAKEGGVSFSAGLLSRVRFTTTP